MTKDASHVPTHNNKDVEFSRTHQGARSIPQSKDSLPRWKQGPRYEYGFNGYCFSCSNFGHKAMICVDGRKSNGHVAVTCHTLRCYMCSEFQHKAQECASQRNQSRRNPLYTSARRISEPWK